MIAFIGDVHRSFGDFERIVDELPSEVAAIIQLGDLGLWPTTGMPSTYSQLTLSRPVYWIDGNWDYQPWFQELEAPTEIIPNVIYVPRGTVLEFDGRKVACVGGAESSSTYRRVKNVNWWPYEERVHWVDIEGIRGRTDIDILATHAPPTTVIRSLYNTEPKGISPGLIDNLWKSLGRPTLVCAHLHQSATIENIRVLNELEVALL